MSGGNDDEEVGRERPGYGSESGGQGAETQNPHQNIKTNEVEEHIIEHARSSQAVRFGHPGQRVGRLVRRRDLIRRHTAEDRVGPARSFSCRFAVLDHILVHADWLIIVVTTEHHIADYWRLEVEESYQQKGYYYQDVGVCAREYILYRKFHYFEEKGF